MFQITRNVNKCFSSSTVKFTSAELKTSQNEIERDDFKSLNLRQVKGQLFVRRPTKKIEILPPRAQQMAVEQNWRNVWPGSRSFQPSSVPMPIRQGYVKKGETIPHKYGNAELMKIPNFLHLTPPVIKRQCESLKKFCTSWPQVLDSDEKCEQYFPLEVTSSSYCHSSPSIRDTLSRIVSVKLHLSSLKFDNRSRDKFLRLVGGRYDETTNIVTITTDRCPTRKQNYDYAMYLITALYHESWNIEDWENFKSEADMEYYDWNNSKSRTTIEKLFGKEFNHSIYIDEYSKALNNLMNDGENEHNLAKYGDGVRNILKMPQKIEVEINN